LQRELELEALSAEEAALKELIWAAEDAARVRSREIELLNAMGRSSTATAMQRERELLAMSLQEAAIAARIWEIQDATDAAAAALDVLREAVDTEIEALTAAHDAQMARLDERLGLEKALAQALNEQANVRAAELAALDASNRSLQTALYRVEDAGSAFAQLEEAIQSQVETASEAAETLAQMSEELHNAIHEFGSTQEQRAASARAELSTMAALARISGALPDAEDLRRVLDDLQQPDAADFRTKQDLEWERAQIAQDLRDLAAVTDEQLPTEEQALEVLEAQLEEARARYHALIGLNEAVLSVDDALTAFNASMSAADAALQGINRESLSALQARIDQADAQHKADIEQLNDLVDQAQSQYDALLEIDSSTRSVEDAVIDLNAALYNLGTALGYPGGVNDGSGGGQAVDWASVAQLAGITWDNPIVEQLLSYGLSPQAVIEQLLQYLEIYGSEYEQGLAEAQPTGLSRMTEQLERMQLPLNTLAASTQPGAGTNNSYLAKIANYVGPGLRDNEIVAWLATIASRISALKASSSIKAPPPPSRIGPPISIEVQRYQSQIDQAGISDDVLRKMIPGYATGGVASGPASGYLTWLHRREAVIPLDDGNEIKVPIRWPYLEEDRVQQRSGDLKLRKSIDELRAVLEALRMDQQRQHHAANAELRDIADVLTRWEAIGPPAERAAA